jgi:hypothetical protein
MPRDAKLWFSCLVQQQQCSNCIVLMEQQFFATGCPVKVAWQASKYLHFTGFKLMTFLTPLLLSQLFV